MSYNESGCGDTQHSISAPTSASSHDSLRRKYHSPIGLPARWPALTRFLDDGRIELDNNTVECAIRPIAMLESLCNPSSSVCKHWKRARVDNATRATFPGHRRFDRLRRQVVGTDLVRCAGNNLHSRKDTGFDKAPYRVVCDA